MKYLALILFFCILIGCGEECPTQESSLPALNGEFQGAYMITFDYATENAQTYSSHLMMNFQDTSYAVASDVEAVPLSGTGSYELRAGSLHLTDTEMRRAIYDWSLILDGWFLCDYDGNNLVMTQLDSLSHRYREIWLVRQ